MPCPLCQEPSASWPQPHTLTLDINCPNCGKYRITTRAFEDLVKQKEAAFDVASWVYGEAKLGMIPKVEQSTIEYIKTYPRPTTKKRVELYLSEVIKMLDNKLMGRFDSTHPRLRVASWSRSAEDTIALAKYLVKMGALEDTYEGTEYDLVVKGHILYDELKLSRAASSQVFVAIWFDEQMKAAFDGGFAKAITNSGYDPIIMNRKEHDEKIDDRIIAEIRQSAFVVADFSGHRQNVYYEAGFAHGLGRRVLFTCRKDCVTNLYFDVRQYNTIEWATPEEIVCPLQNRILALFGAGPLKPDAKAISEG